jgi:F-type H+-transporting ATPase subunit gamma
VIYNKFINVGKQEVRYEKFLPLKYEGQDESSSIMTDRIYEPSKASVVKAMVPKYLNTQIWQYLLESFASEQAARMLAMENATTNAEDMIKDLSLKFNKARQSAITTEMLEIVSGAEALN